MKLLASPRQVMPLEDLMRDIRPFDYAATWPEVFGAIERNHYQFAPAHWDKFLRQIKGQGILVGR
jgi:hypothetical protein